MARAAEDRGLVADLDEAAKAKFRSVPRLDVRASAGPGGMAISEIPISTFNFSERWLRDLAQGSPDGLSMITVRGDSMWPTLVDGDKTLSETWTYQIPPHE